MRLHFKIISLLVLIFLLQLGVVENLGGGLSEINLFLVVALFLSFFGQRISAFLPYVLICSFWDGVFGASPLGYEVIVYLAIFVLIHGLKKTIFRKETGGVFIFLALAGFIIYYLGDILSFYFGGNLLPLNVLLDKDTFFFFLYNGLICVGLGYGNFFSWLTAKK